MITRFDMILAVLSDVWQEVPRFTRIVILLMLVIFLAQVTTWFISYDSFWDSITR